MNTNWYKTKEMLLGAKSAFISDLCECCRTCSCF